MQSIAKFMINPLLYIFAALLYFTFKYDGHRKLIIPVVIYFYLISIPITGYMFWSVWQTNDSFKPAKEYDVALVLAGSVDHNWYLKQKKYGNLLFDTERYFQFNQHSERIYAGIEFVRSGNAKNLLYSNFKPKAYINGRYESVNAAEMVKRFAVFNGIPEKNVILYGNQVKRTVDEAMQFKIFLEANKMPEVLLITSESHMRRATALFHKQGIFLDTFSVMRMSPIMKQLKNINNFIPSHEGIKLFKNCLYELVGYIGYYFLGNI